MFKIITVQKHISFKPPQNTALHFKHTHRISPATFSKASFSNVSELGSKMLNATAESQLMER